MKHKISRLGALLLAAALLFSLTPAVLATDSVSVKLDRTEAVLPLDGTCQLTVTVDGKTVKASDLTWTTADAAVATVDTEGKVSAVAAGETVVTVAYLPEGADPAAAPTASCKIKVAAPAVSLNVTSLTLAEKDTVELKATVSNEVKNGKLEYKIDEADLSVIKFSENKLTAMGKGTASVKVVYTYTVGSDRYVAEAECSVTVNELSITTTPAEKFSLEVGESRVVEGTTNSAAYAIKWVSSAENVASVDTKGKVTALSPGTANITAMVGGMSSAPVVVTVSGVVLDKTLDLFLGKSAQLTPILFGNATSQTILWSSSNVSVASVKNGKVIAYNVGTTVITATAGSYSASCTVTVTEDVADDVFADVTQGRILSFSGTLLEELREVAKEQLGENLIYISGLTVSPDHGTLYYAYSSADAPGQGVGSRELYYAATAQGQKRLEQVSFVPNPAFTGTAVITYTGYGSSGSFAGRIRVRVSSSGDVSCNTPAETPILLDAEDFSVICEEKTGRALRYVTFTLPAASKGTLYYNYSAQEDYSLRVDETTKYYLTGGGMQLSRITFLPQEGFSGLVSIPYYGTDTAGERYSGVLTITVYADGGSAVDSVTYQTEGGTAVEFSVEDFREACLNAVGSSLYYVYFELPDPVQGTLYYNYRTPTQYGGLVSETTRYFSSSTSMPLIRKISFVPERDFGGVVSIPYKGYSVTGKSFDGVVTIRVSNSAGAISYTVTMDRPVTFDGLDFKELCQAVNGAGLDEVSFVLPSVSEGTLYYNYKSTSTVNSRVSEFGSYDVYDLSYISFVPRSGFSGEVSIPFNGTDLSGNRFNGTVRITVEPRYIDDVIRYKGVSGGRTYFSAEDFNEISLLLTGDNLDYVVFSSPSVGRMGYNGSITYSYTFYRMADTSTARLLDKAYYTAQKGYSGTVTLNYTGRSINGMSFSGTVKIAVSVPVAETITLRGSSLPISLRASDFETACADVLPQTLSSIEFEALPDASQGRLLLNYTQPNTGTAVKAGTKYYLTGNSSVNDICFVAKADYQGTVSLTYTALDRNGNEVKGTVELHISNDNLSLHFIDLRSHIWAAPSIEYVYECGIMDGTGIGQFKPGNLVSREVFVGAVCRMLDFAPQVARGFTDVTEDNPYYTEILTAQALGIVNGKGNGLFGPEEVITREEAIAILVRAMKAAKITVETGSALVLDGYNDRSAVSNYAVGDMASMIKMGILKGDSAGNLKPQSKITRAEMAILIHRVLTL